MSAAAYPDPAIEVRPASAFVGFLAAFANLPPPHGESLPAVEAALAQGEVDISRGIEAVSRLVINRRMAAERGEPVAWNYLIDRLEFYEVEAVREVAQIRRLVHRILAFIGVASPTDRASARALARRQEDAVVRFVEALRDARWQAMAARAHFDDASREGQIFDDGKRLRRTLANL